MSSVEMSKGFTLHKKCPLFSMIFFSFCHLYFYLLFLCWVGVHGSIYKIKFSMTCSLSEYAYRQVKPVYNFLSLEPN
jgi:hypothetical protein